MVERIYLNGIERRLQQPFRVASLGEMKSNRSTCNIALPPFLELCLRLSAQTPTLKQTVEGKNYTSRYPHVIIKKPNMHYCRNHAVTDQEIFYISFTAESATCFKQAGLLREPLVWDIELTPDITDLIQEIKESQEHSVDYGMADQIDTLCYLLWVKLDRQKKCEAEENDFHEQQIRRISSYLQLHFKEELDYTELARRYGMSRRTFFRHWTRVFEHTPHQFVINLKLQEACWLLRDCNMSPDQVCQVLNFRQTNYFSKLFRENFGMTPARYRNK